MYKQVKKLLSSSSPNQKITFLDVDKAVNSQVFKTCLGYEWETISDNNQTHGCQSKQPSAKPIYDCECEENTYDNGDKNDKDDDFGFTNDDNDDDGIKNNDDDCVQIDDDDDNFDEDCVEKL